MQHPKSMPSTRGQTAALEAVQAPHTHTNSNLAQQNPSSTAIAASLADSHPSHTHNHNGLSAPNGAHSSASTTEPLLAPHIYPRPDSTDERAHGSADSAHTRSASMNQVQPQPRQEAVSMGNLPSPSRPLDSLIQPNHHRHSASLGQMGSIAVQQQHPQQHQPRNHYASLRMSTSSPLQDVDTAALEPPRASMPSGRPSHTGTTPNLANLAIYTTQNGSAFVRSLSQQQQHNPHHHNTANSSVRSTSPSNSSIASTSWTSPSVNNPAAASAGGICSPLTSVDSRFSGAPSMCSRDVSMDGFSNSNSISRASSASAPASQQEFTGSGLGINTANRQKHKMKLLNVDRKRICIHHLQNPNMKQEALAQTFGIERSTVSKILKEQDRWLAIPDDGQDELTSKHRSPRYPELEEYLATWARHAQASGQLLSDATIRRKALEVAQHFPTDAQGKKFKASGGWVDKFRVRAGLKRANTSTVVIDSSTQHIDATSSLECGLSSISPISGDPALLSSVPSSRSVSNTSQQSSAMSQQYASQDSYHHGSQGASNYGFQHGRHGSSTPVRSPTAFELGQQQGGYAPMTLANATPGSKQKRQYDAMAGDQNIEVGRAGHQSTPMEGRDGGSMPHHLQQEPGLLVNEFGQVVSPPARGLLDPANADQYQQPPRQGHATAQDQVTPHNGYSSDSKRRRGGNLSAGDVSIDARDAGMMLGSPFNEEAMQAHSMGRSSQIRARNQTWTGDTRGDLIYTPSHRPGELQGHTSAMMLNNPMTASESTMNGNAVSQSDADGNAIGITTDASEVLASHSPVSPLRPLRLSDLGRSKTTPHPMMMSTKQDQQLESRALAQEQAGMHFHQHLAAAAGFTGQADGRRLNNASLGGKVFLEQPVQSMQRSRSYFTTTPRKARNEHGHSHMGIAAHDDEDAVEMLNESHHQNRESRRPGGAMPKSRRNHDTDADAAEDVSGMPGRPASSPNARSGVLGELSNVKSMHNVRSRTISSSFSSSSGSSGSPGAGTRPASIGPGGASSSGGGGGSAISLDQARESLDIVLQFLNESEEADIIPRSHFLTLGSLHGSLSAAAAAALLSRRRSGARRRVDSGTSRDEGDEYEREDMGEDEVPAQQRQHQRQQQSQRPSQRASHQHQHQHQHNTRQKRVQQKEGAGGR